MNLLAFYLKLLGVLAWLCTVAQDGLKHCDRWPTKYRQNWHLTQLIAGSAQMGLELVPERFRVVGNYSFVWNYRAQEPTTNGPDHYSDYQSEDQSTSREHCVLSWLLHIAGFLALHHLTYG